MKIGVISDTHDVLTETTLRFLRGVDCILHMGDIGQKVIFDELQAIAPVSAVCGNCDPAIWGRQLPQTREITLEGYKIFMIHDLGEGNFCNLSAELYCRWKNFNPRIALFGHIHRPVNVEKAGVLYFNPGSPTRPRGGHVPTVGILHLSLEAIVAEHIPV